MERCYYCECELNEANKSLEHIIPNALCGHLANKNILCKECNHKLSKVDCALSDNLNGFFGILQIKRDRDSQKDYEKRSVKAKIGDYEVTIRPGMRIDPIATKESGIIKRTTWTDDVQEIEKERQRLIDSACKFEERSGNKKTREEIEAKIETKVEYVECPKEIKADIKIENIILGYLKIAIGFCCFKDKGQHIQKDIFELFKKYCEMAICEKTIEPADIIDNLGRFLRLIDNKPIKENNDRIYHYIFLVGDENQKKLFCIVSLFEYIELAFILNDNYESESFQEEYVFDLEASKDVAFTYENIMNNTFDFNMLKRYSDVNISKKQAPLCRLFGAEYMNYLYR